MGACKRHSDAQVSTGDVRDSENILMCNHCIEQCAIYTFFTCGSHLEWAFGPKIPLLTISGSSGSR